MNLTRVFVAISILVVLSLDLKASAQVIGAYEAQKLAAKQTRLEKKGREMRTRLDGVMSQQERAALQQVQLEFPTLSFDGSLLNFYANSQKNTVVLPIHSLLLLEDICTAYAWLHVKGFSPITINEYASMLKHRRAADFPSGAYPPPLAALAIPNDALKNKEVDELSLRFRNSAYAFVLAHELGHILYKHPGNKAVPPEKSRANEREADEFALRVLARDKQIPMGAILFFQMTAFTLSPSRFDYATVEQWQQSLQAATHPVTSDRVRGVSEALRKRIADYGKDGTAALFVAEKLKTIATEMDDPDWQLYFRGIGQRAPLDTLRPKKK